MLVEFDFAVTQTAYVKAAMDEIPSFRPDGETPVQVQARVDSATPVRTAYVTKKNAIDGARALRRTTIETLHEGCIDFLAQGRSRFRKNPTVKERFDRLPVDDKTFQETMTRAAANAALWTVLPLVGTPPGAFLVGQDTATLGLAGFQGLMAAAGVADGAIPGTDQDFQGAEGEVHEKQAELEDFVTAALELGRSQYDEGTAEREIIDAVPLQPPTGGGGGGGTPPPPPVPAPTALEIASLVVDDPVAATVTYVPGSGADATTRTLQYKLPADADFGHDTPVVLPAQQVVDNDFSAALVVFRTVVTNVTGSATGGEQSLQF